MIASALLIALQRKDFLRIFSTFCGKLLAHWISTSLQDLKNIFKEQLKNLLQLAYFILLLYGWRDFSFSVTFQDSHESFQICRTAFIDCFDIWLSGITSTYIVLLMMWLVHDLNIDPILKKYCKNDRF